MQSIQSQNTAEFAFIGTLLRFRKVSIYTNCQFKQETTNNSNPSVFPMLRCVM